MLKLTPRQQTFLDKLFELYDELKGPIHYSVLADALGVNKFSAYDMLKVLEEKGMAASEYVLNDDQTGPGRSQVVFYPTNQAAQFLTQLRDEVRHGTDWNRIKGRILRRLKRSKDTGATEALREALTNLPDAKAPLNYCAEMVSVSLLNIVQQRNTNLETILSTLNPKNRVGLGTLAGLSLGSILSSEDEDAGLSSKLLTHTKSFQRQLSELSDDSISKLSTLASDALMTLSQQYQPIVNPI